MGIRVTVQAKDYTPSFAYPNAEAFDLDASDNLFVRDNRGIEIAVFRAGIWTQAEVIPTEAKL